MRFGDKFVVKPGRRVRLAEIDPGTTGHYASADAAKDETDACRARLAKRQSLLWAERSARC